MYEVFYIDPLLKLRRPSDKDPLTRSEKLCTPSKLLRP